MSEVDYSLFLAFPIFVSFVVGVFFAAVPRRRTLAARSLVVRAVGVLSI